jgi:hypothetical protein
MSNKRGLLGPHLKARVGFLESLKGPARLGGQLLANVAQEILHTGRLH